MRPAALLLALTLAACSGSAGTAGTGGPAARDNSDSSPQASPSSTPARDPRPPAGAVRLARVTTLMQPLALATRPDDPALYIAQKTGEVIRLVEGRHRVVLNLADRVSQGGEQGLLGLDFSPDGDLLYVNLTDLAGDTLVEEYAMGRRRPDPDSRREVLFVEQPFSNHNGGNLAFGPDGYLYVGLGDGGSGGDPMDNAQSLDTLLGKMLRIDPLGGDPYAVPDDNPFVDREGARHEIWAYGLRNPWRYSFDRETGDLWIGDVGQSSREEIDRQPGGSAGGENFGWNRLEGTRPYEGEPPPDAVPPVHEYGRDLGATVIGGSVYRGAKLPWLDGAYLFADYYRGEIMTIRRKPSGVLSVKPLGPVVGDIVSFGENEAGEVFALSLAGGVFRLAPDRR